MDVRTQMLGFQGFEGLHEVFGPGRPHEWPRDFCGISGQKTFSFHSWFWGNFKDMASKGQKNLKYDNDPENSEQLEWRHPFYRSAPRSSKNKKNILRTCPLVRNFPLIVAASFLEHSFGAFIEQSSPFIPAWRMAPLHLFYWAFSRLFQNNPNIPSEAS